MNGKAAVVHIYSGILLSHNAFESVLMRWMNLEPVIQNEIRKRKQMSYTNENIWNLERWYWWTYLQGSSGDADTENTLVDPVWKGEGGMNWKSDVETCILPYLKWLASGSLLCDAGNSNLVFCDNLRGVQWGRRCEGGDICITYGWFMLMDGRN